MGLLTWMSLHTYRLADTSSRLTRLFTFQAEAHQLKNVLRCGHIAGKGLTLASRALPIVTGRNLRSGYHFALCFACRQHMLQCLQHGHPGAAEPPRDAGAHGRLAQAAGQP